MLDQMTRLLMLANAEQRLLLAREKTVDNFLYDCDYYLIEFAWRTYTGGDWHWVVISIHVHSP